MSAHVHMDADAKAAGHAPAADWLPHTTLSRIIDPLIVRIGSAASWLWLLLVIVIIGQVAMRYVLGQGSIMLEELQWHIYGVGFLLGLAYCTQADRHVRVDVIADRLRARTRAKIEITGILIFLLPFAAAVVIEGFKLAQTAWLLDEVSAAPGGLPYRWVIKAFIPLGFVLLCLAGLSRLSRCFALVFGRKGG